MSVIVELSLPAEEFELGRILALPPETTIRLETLVPLGDHSIPFFRLHNGANDFEESVSAHPAVEDIHIVSSTEDETLYALNWTIASDTFFEGVRSLEGHVLEATGTDDAWRFELRFPTHDALSTFQAHCIDADIPIDISRIYNPTKPDAGPWFGLTARQREMLTRAVESGYYAIPRQTSTIDLAEEFGISDQAVTERLRRAIETLVMHTILHDKQPS